MMDFQAQMSFEAIYILCQIIFKKFYSDRMDKINLIEIEILSIYEDLIWFIG